MNKKLIIVLAIIAIAGIGLVAYLLTQNDNDSNNNVSDSSSPTETVKISTDTPEFSLASTTNKSFTATINGTTDDQTYNATIKNDGLGNSQYTGQADGKEFELYVLGDRNIVCTDGQCIETSNTIGLSPIDQDQYEITDEDLENYRESALYKGTAECSAGTCEKWEVSVSEFTGTLLVDNDGRINQISTTVEGNTYTVDFTYEEVTITPPENVITIPLNQ
jgi:uncharacterized protein YxeA